MIEPSFKRRVRFDQLSGRSRRQRGRIVGDRAIEGAGIALSIGCENGVPGHGRGINRLSLNVRYIHLTPSLDVSYPNVGRFGSCLFFA